MTRLQKLIKVMPAEVDALLITNNKNQTYLTGFEFHDGLVLVTRQTSYLITDFRYIEAAKKEASHEFSIITHNGGLVKTAAELVDSDIIIGYEDASITVEVLEQYKKALPSARFMGAGRIVEGLRIKKEPCEIDAMIAAQRIAEKAFDHILGFITPERTEVEVALELEFTMRRLGAKATSFNTIAVAGKKSAMPHGVPSDVKLGSGFFTMDFGALYQGYCSDMTRTVVIGKADDDMKKVYNTVLEAQTAALAAYDFGKTGREIDKVARDIIYAAGYEGCFGHGLGHGVGMDIHEAPGVNFASLTPFEAGHVVTCEPGIYIEGKYGVRIEDMVVFRDGSVEDITKCPKNLIEL
ncbi:MAG: aminopeptidase P family protein [Clostridia bacterium]|nr:aminopeptidase P family protein [Clostridia bacterium]